LPLVWCVHLGIVGRRINWRGGFLGLTSLNARPFSDIAVPGAASRFTRDGIATKRGSLHPSAACALKLGGQIQYRQERDIVGLMILGCRCRIPTYSTLSIQPLVCTYTKSGVRIGLNYNLRRASPVTGRDTPPLAFHATPPSPAPPEP
jgi:hypothetical protein